MLNKLDQLHYLRVWLVETLRVESTEIDHDDPQDRWYTFAYYQSPETVRLTAWFGSDGCDGGPYNIERFDCDVTIDSCVVVFTNTEYPYVKLPLRRVLDWIDGIGHE